MSKYEKDPMQISERELKALTKDVDELHHATLPKMQEQIAEWSELNQELRRTEGGFLTLGTSRRRFLIGAGAVVGGLELAACGGDDEEETNAGGTTDTSAEGGEAGGEGGGKLTGDLQIAAMAASLENLAVGAYGAALDAAKANKLGAVPPAIATFAQTAQQHHRDHAAAWNAILTASGEEAVTVPNPAVKPMVDEEFAKIKDVTGVAKLALSLEDVAAATYLNGLSVIKNEKAIQTAASIQPVEMQHAAILNFVMGQYPVPNTFAKTEGARPPEDFPG